MQFLRHAKKYSAALHGAFVKRPMLANSCTGFVTFAIGDIMSQYGIIKTERIDIMRSFRTGCLGVFMNGVMLHYWYRCLDRVFGSCMKTTQTVILKCVADQMVYAPFSIMAFFSYASVNKGGTTTEIKERFVEKSKESFVNTWVADCTVWPIINAVSFSLVPIHIRPTFVALAQVGWQTYMSHVGFKPVQMDAALQMTQTAL
jgi:hypothetical protein